MNYIVKTFGNKMIPIARIYSMTYGKFHLNVVGANAL